MSRRKDFSTKPKSSMVSFNACRGKKEMESKLRHIFFNLDSLETDWPEFRENVSKWTRHRRTTIVALQNTAKNLDEIHRNSNIAKCVGDVASVVGAFAELFGHLMEDSSTSRDVKQFGRNLNRIGSATTFGTSLIEEGMSSMKMQNVRERLKEDEELLKLIAPWFQRARRIDETLKEIFEIGLMTDFEERGKVIIFEIFKMVNSGKVVITEVTDSLIHAGYDIDKADFRSFTQVMLPKFMNTLQDICNNERLRPIFESILNIAENVFGVMQSCIKILSNPSLNLESIFGSFLNNLSVSTELARFVPGALSQSLFITGKIASLISTSDELIQGEPSKYAKILRDLREEMIEEYNTIYEEFAARLNTNRNYFLPQIVG